MKVEFFRHNLGEDCLGELAKTASGLFLTTGPKTAEFEQRFAEYLGVPHAVGLMSCTHALHLAYRGLDIGEGDEVIVPACTFAATATGVMHAGAQPVFAEVDPDTGIMTPEHAEAAITEKTKAICVVHLYGRMAPMDRFAELCERRGLKLIEDSAHCVEGYGPGFKPGTLSDAAAFSFYATKNITSGEGGALATRHKELAERVKFLRNHGLTRSAHDRFGNKTSHYDIEELGFKSNMNDIQASLLMPQLEKIEERLKRRQDIVYLYEEALSDVNGIITPPPLPDGYRSALHLYTIRVAKPEKREAMLQRLIDEGVGCAVNYYPLHTLSLLQRECGLKEGMFPNAEAMGNSVISLPLYPLLKDEEASYVADVVKKAAAELL